MIKKNIEITYLRGIAILMVIFHHSNTYLWTNTSFFNSTFHYNLGLWSGVDLFFVISGYVITESFYQKYTKIGSFKDTLKTFYTKRFIRIIPPAFIWLGIYLLLTKYFNNYGSFGDLNQNIQDSYPAIFQFANYYGLSCWGPGKIMECGPNGIYWSLSLEEQFYFSLPILIYILKHNLKYFLLVLILLSIFITRPEWTFWWAFRIDAIAWGVFLNLTSDLRIYVNVRAILIKTKFFRIVVFILIFLILIFCPIFKTTSVSIAAFASFVLMAVAIGEQNIFFPSQIINRALYWFGTRSYSIYLTHIISFRLFLEIYQRQNVFFSGVIENFVLSVGAYLILLILAETSYRIIELPIINLAEVASLKIRSRQYI